MCHRPVSILPAPPLHLLYLLPYRRLASPRRDDGMIGTEWNGLMNRTFKGLESRRRGVYHVACLSMKCYFKVRLPTSSTSPRLCFVLANVCTSSNAVRVVDEMGTNDEERRTDDRSANRIYVRISYEQ